MGAIYVNDMISAFEQTISGVILIFLATTILNDSKVSMIVLIGGMIIMFLGFIRFLYKFFKNDKDEKPINPHGTLPKGFGNDSTRNDET